MRAYRQDSPLAIEKVGNLSIPAIDPATGGIAACLDDLRGAGPNGARFAPAGRVEHLYAR